MVQKLLQKPCLVAAVLCFFGSGVAQAATINIVRNAVDPHESVYGLHADTGAEGYELAGAQVTAGFADGSTETLTWMADPTIYTEPTGETYGSQNGFADGANIDMFMSWDGFEMSTTSLLTSLSIDLAPGNAVFDTTFVFDHDPSGASTPGSSFGYEFELYSAFQSLPGTITATYSGIVNLAGAASAGDLFTTMTLDFTGVSGGGILGDLHFRSDIDAMAYANDLTPLPAVPLPASLPFLLCGLLVLMMTARKPNAAQIPAHQLA